MKTMYKLFTLTAIQFALVGIVFAQKTIIEDEGVNISDSEFEYLVTRWTGQMRDAAVADAGDRLELINMALANKKVARLASEVALENSSLRWSYQLGLEAYQRDFVSSAVPRTRCKRQTVSDSGARAIYSGKYRDKIAAVPEKRVSSHILIAVQSLLDHPQDREEIRPTAQGVLDQLRAGADFSKMVAESLRRAGCGFEKDGKFDRWVSLWGDSVYRVDTLHGLFSIASVGEYSDLVATSVWISILFD